MEQYRPLVMRSNRFLGSALVERNLIEVPDLEAANSRLLEVIKCGELRQASLLNILFFDLSVLEEEDLIERVLEEAGLGLIELANYDLTRVEHLVPDVNLCWATQTVPFDRIEGFNFLATSYYLSQPARKHWEEALEGEIIWYVTPTSSVANALETLEQLNQNGEGAAEAAEA
jgi:hypothetical protein